MRAAAWETAPQRALGNCFKEVGGEVNIYALGKLAEQVSREIDIFRSGFYETNPCTCSHLEKP